MGARDPFLVHTEFCNILWYLIILFGRKIDRDRLTYIAILIPNFMLIKETRSYKPNDNLNIPYGDP